MINKNDLKVDMLVRCHNNDGVVAWVARVLSVSLVKREGLLLEIISSDSYSPGEKIFRSIDNLTRFDRYEIFEMSAVKPEVPRINYRAIE